MKGIFHGGRYGKLRSTIFFDHRLYFGQVYWLMKSPLFTGHHLLQKYATPVSEELVSDLEGETTDVAVSSSLPVQAKLTIGEPGDKYEMEADSVAADVVSRINTPQSQTVQREEMAGDEDELQIKPVSGTIQREEMPGDEAELQMKPVSYTIQREEMVGDEEELQMKPMVQRVQDGGGMAASADLEGAIQGARGSGQPLGDEIREPMEQAFGADFTGVRVHTDAQSDALNQSIQAKAFTTGSDIFFRQGAYEPSSRGGQELLAHELTHVVQQSGGQASKNAQRQSQVIQRMGDFGIEYETPAEMYDESNNDEAVPDGQKITDPAARNWYIESDSGHIEFITTRGDINHTKNALNNIAKEVDTIKTNTNTKTSKEKQIKGRTNVPMKELSPTVKTDKKADEVFATKIPRSYNGKIQFTGNIPIKDYPALMRQLSELKFIAYAGNLLEQHQENQGEEESKKVTALHALATPAQEYMLKSTKREMIKTTEEKSKAVVKEIEKVVPQLKSKDALKGLIQLMLDYASQINNKGNSSNLKESITVMTRADFNSIYHKSIAQQDQQDIAQNQQQVVGIITQAIQNIIDDLRRNKNGNYQSNNLLLGSSIERTFEESQREDVENKKQNIETKEWVNSVIGDGIGGLANSSEKKDWLSSDNLLNDTDSKAMGKQVVKDQATSGDWLVPFEYRGMPSAQVDATKAEKWLLPLIENLFTSNPAKQLDTLKGKDKLGKEMEAYNELRLLLIFLEYEIVRTEQQEQTASGAQMVWKLEQNPDKISIQGEITKIKGWFATFGNPKKYYDIHKKWPDYVSKLEEIEKKYLRPGLLDAANKLGVKLK